MYVSVVIIEYDSSKDRRLQGRKLSELFFSLPFFSLLSRRCDERTND